MQAAFAPCMESTQIQTCTGEKDGFVPVESYCSNFPKKEILLFFFFLFFKFKNWLASPWLQFTVSHLPSAFWCKSIQTLEAPLVFSYFSSMYAGLFYAWKSSRHVYHCLSLAEHGDSSFHGAYKPTDPRKIKSVLSSGPRQQVLTIGSNGNDPFNHDAQVMSHLATAP